MLGTKREGRRVEDLYAPTTRELIWPCATLLFAPNVLVVSYLIEVGTHTHFHTYISSS